mmetsp:Transcript_10389/g.63392  ORF Transcript_10389/g.63392 Transcript_10389/m.63392 type:complete len:209 (-) Transcript_10389:148-774(-)
MDAQPRPWTGRNRVSDVLQQRLYSSTNPLAPIPFVFLGKRRFPILSQSAVIVSCERILFQRVVRSLVRLYSPSPSLFASVSWSTTMHVRRTRVLRRGFVDLSLSSLFGQRTISLFPLVSRTSWASFDSTYRSTGRCAPSQLAKESHRTRFEGCVSFFSGIACGFFPRRGRGFARCALPARRSGSHFRFTCSSFQSRKMQGRARALACA